MMLKKIFFKLMNNAVFGKTMETCHNNLVSEPNYHTTTILTENLLTIEMKKTRDAYE